MRAAFYFSPQAKRSRGVLSLRGLLLLLTIESFLFSRSAFEWSIRVVVIVVAGLLCDVIANRLTSQVALVQRDKSGPVRLRRFWHRSGASTNPYTWGGPVIVALSAVCVFMFIHWFMMMALYPLRFAIEYDSGVWSMRLALKTTYIALMLYILAHVAVGLLPATRLPQHGFAMLFFSLCMIATAYHIMFLF